MENSINSKVNNNGYNYIDLDLPSHTLWATMNVGASKPSDFGLYFQWGSVRGFTKGQIGKDKAFSWSDYKFSLDGSFSNVSKYTTDGESLELADDAANANMGGSWHIPTPTQIRELINETDNTWTTQNGVNGRLFTSKKNGKSIFIPAAGYAWDGSLYFSGDGGGVWSSVLSAGYVDSGQNLGFNSGCAGLGYDYRGYGFSVRGVLDKSALKVSDSHKHFELNDKVLVGLAFNNQYAWRRDIYLNYDEDKKCHCTFYESMVPDSLIIPYDKYADGQPVPFKYYASSNLDNKNRPKFSE